MSLLPTEMDWSKLLCPSVLFLNCRLFSLSLVLRGEGRGEGLFKLDNPFQKIPSGGDSTFVPRSARFP
jgi:hypothetical protein